MKFQNACFIKVALIKWILRDSWQPCPLAKKIPKPFTKSTCGDRAFDESLVSILYGITYLQSI